MTIRINGIGTSLPEKVLTNHDLSTMMDTSDQWIRDRAGIGSRHVGGVTSEMAIEAGANALKDADLSPADVDLLVLCTTTPDQRFPATSAVVQAGLGLGCGAFDINAVCAGFTYGYVTSYGLMMLPGGPERLLLIGSDAMSPITDWSDRSTAILFGDGAAAVVMERHEQGELLAFDLGADGNLQPILYCDHDGFIRMEGREVFKKAVRAVTQSVATVLDKAGVDPHDVDVVLPHQANIRIIEAVCQRIGIPIDKTYNVLETTGNTSGASIPLAMAKADAEGALEPGRIVVMSGFGAGMAWGLRGGVLVSRTVLVTGGNRGIGLATARRFRDAGHRAAVTSRSGHADDADGLLVATCDVTDRASVDAAVDQVEAELGPVEILVSNAGITHDGLVLRMGDDDFSEVIDTNLTGGFRVARRVVRGMMRGRWGRMVFVSSVVGLGGQAGQANYAASKAGLIGLARSLAKEFASRNITVNVVAPGPIRTDMLAALTDEQREAMLAVVPVGRLGEPHEIAAAIEFLASEDAGYVTGTVLAVDGGLSMG